MTWTDRSFLVLDPQHTESAFGLAVAAELRRLHPHNTSGLIAQRLKCTKRAAENLLDGHLSAKSITRLARAYGLGFMIDVSAAVAGETLEEFIRNRAAAARREAERWAALDYEEPIDAPVPHSSRSHRMADSEGRHRRVP